MTAVQALPAGRAAMLQLGQASFTVDPAGALFWRAERLLVVADLHFEKGSSYATRRVFLPPYDTAATLARLTELVMRLAPRAVVALGDSFHDRYGAARLAARDRAALRALQAGRHWVWVAGNHDPEPPADLDGDSVAELSIGGVAFRHLPTVGGGAEIAGHLHPVARVSASGGTVRRRCVATDGHRCVLPAFGAYAGGLNLLDKAFTSLFAGRDCVAHVLGRSQVYAIPQSRCLPD